MNHRILKQGPPKTKSVRLKGRTAGVRDQNRKTGQPEHDLEIILYDNRLLLLS